MSEGDDAPEPLVTARFAGYASLVTSAGTLVCCALPALMVALGAGAVLAATVSAFPALIWLSTHKLIVFGAAGVMLLGVGVLQRRARSAPCPVAQAAACARARRLSSRVYALSVGVFCVGAFFAFVAPMLV